MRDILQRLRLIILFGAVEPMEMWTAVVAMMWGGWLFNPVVYTFASAPGYNGMNMVAPEWVWGMITSMLGVIQFWGLLRDDFPARRLASMALAGVWAFASAGMIFWDWRYTSTVSYPLMAVASIWVYYRLGQEGDCG